MAYLTSTDFDVLIQDVNLQQIINNNAALLDQVSLIATGEARSYLVQKYDFEAELLLTGDARDPQLVSYICDIALFHLHSRISPRNVPELRVTRYDNAIHWLKMCAMGDATPKLLEYTTPKTVVRWGSQPKNTNSY